MFEQCQRNIFDSENLSPKAMRNFQIKAQICKSCKFPHEAFNGNKAMQATVAATEGSRASIDSRKS